jgi:5-formyltetrahydrofolate cyclo-ligase
MKKELRKVVLALRKNMNQKAIDDKSRKVYEQIIQLDEYKAAKTVMLYLNFRNEVKTDLILQDAVAKGKKIVVPLALLEQKVMLPVEIVQYPEDLEVGAYGILEPKPDKALVVTPEEIDLVLVPGVAFDYQGYRLGYGAGYYDKFLPLVREDTHIIALAFELQLNQTVYPDHYDIPMEKIATEDRVIECIRD